MQDDWYSHILLSETRYVIRIVFAFFWKKLFLTCNPSKGLDELWGLCACCRISADWQARLSPQPLLHSFPQHPALRFTSLPHSFPLLRPEKHFIAARKWESALVYWFGSLYNKTAVFRDTRCFYNAFFSLDSKRVRAGWSRVGKPNISYLCHILWST